MVNQINTAWNVSMLNSVQTGLSSNSVPGRKIPIEGQYGIMFIKQVRMHYKRDSPYCLLAVAKATSMPIWKFSSRNSYLSLQLGNELPNEPNFDINVLKKC